MERELAQIERKKTRLIDAYLSGEIREDEMVKMRAQYESRMQELQGRRQTTIERMKTEREQSGNAAQLLNELLAGEAGSEILYRTIVRDITVF